MEKPIDYYSDSAAVYDQMMSANAVDLTDRDNFRALVCRYTKCEQLLIDFGGGTGMDAVFYAQKGYRVLLFDVSLPMCEQAQLKIDQLKLGDKIEVCCGDLQKLVSRVKALDQKCSIAANFSVLNLVDNPQQDCRTLLELMGPENTLICSVGNPYRISHFKLDGALKMQLPLLRHGVTQSPFHQTSYWYLTSQFFKRLADNVVVKHQQFSTPREVPVKLNNPSLSRVLTPWYSAFRFYVLEKQADD